jgi:hypothetical protein
LPLLDNQLAYCSHYSLRFTSASNNTQKLNAQVKRKKKKKNKTETVFYSQKKGQKRQGMSIIFIDHIHSPHLQAPSMWISQKTFNLKQRLSFDGAFDGGWSDFAGNVPGPSPRLDVHLHRHFGNGLPPATPRRLGRDDPALLCKIAHRSCLFPKLFNPEKCYQEKMRGDILNVEVWKFK